MPWVSNVAPVAATVMTPKKIPIAAKKLHLRRDPICMSSSPRVKFLRAPMS